MRFLRTDMGHHDMNLIRAETLQENVGLCVLRFANFMCFDLMWLLGSNVGTVCLQYCVAAAR